MIANASSPRDEGLTLEEVRSVAAELGVDPSKLEQVSATIPAKELRLNFPVTVFVLVWITISMVVLVGTRGIGSGPEFLLYGLSTLGLPFVLGLICGRKWGTLVLAMSLPLSTYLVQLWHYGFAVSGPFDALLVASVGFVQAVAGSVCSEYFLRLRSQKR